MKGLDKQQEPYQLDKYIAAIFTKTHVSVRVNMSGWRALMSDVNYGISNVGTVMTSCAGSHHNLGHYHAKLERYMHSRLHKNRNHLNITTLGQEPVSSGQPKTKKLHM